MINTIACISLFTDAFLILNITIKDQCAQESRFTGCHDLENQVRMPIHGRDGAIVPRSPFLGHICYPTYTHTSLFALTTLLLQSRAKCEGVAIGTSGPALRRVLLKCYEAEGTETVYLTKRGRV